MEKALGSSFRRTNEFLAPSASASLNAVSSCAQVFKKKSDCKLLIPRGRQRLDLTFQKHLFNWARKQLGVRLEPRPRPIVVRDAKRIGQNCQLESEKIGARVERLKRFLRSTSKRNSNQCNSKFEFDFSNTRPQTTPRSNKYFCLIPSFPGRNEGPLSDGFASS
jgi:hypothetical protein